MSEKSLFEKISQKEIPAHIVWDDEQFIAFLDIAPLSRGHCLVVPKKNWGDNLFNLTKKRYHQLLEASRFVSMNLQKALNVNRVFMVVEGLEVAHVHVKLIPNYENSGILELKKLKFDQDQFRETADLIRGVITESVSRKNN